MATSNLELQPLHLWEVLHGIWNEEDQNEDEVVHYIVLPSADSHFVKHALGLKDWRIKGQLPWTIKHMGQLTNLFSYAPARDNFYCDVKRREYYDPVSQEKTTFDRDDETHKATI